MPVATKGARHSKDAGAFESPRSTEGARVSESARDSKDANAFESPRVTEGARALGASGPLGAPGPLRAPGLCGS